jgi:putative SOS response-associated peptidase YedK
MCGRFTLYDEPQRYAEALDAEIADGVTERFEPSWNVPPTEQVLAVTERRDARVLDRYRWGLIPSWVDDLSKFRGATFNARAESVATKPAFRAAFISRRCLVPADDYFEWKTTDGSKQPHLVHRVDGEPLVLAGLWEARKHPEGEWLRSCTIITTEAGDDMSDVHDRMPVILEPDAWERWIDRRLNDRAELEAMLKPAPRGTLVHFPVDRRVGSVRNNDPSLIVPVESGALF